MANTMTPKVIAEVKKKPWSGMIAGAVYDPSGKDPAMQFRDGFNDAISGGGLRMYPADNRKHAGFESVKGALSPVLGSPKIYFSKKCNDSRREMFGYKKNPKTGEPIQTDDHAPDEIRYFCMWKANPIKKKSKSEAIKKKRR